MVKCPVCGKSLAHNGALAGHLAMAHGRRWGLAGELDVIREQVEKIRRDIPEREWLRDRVKELEVKLKENKGVSDGMAEDMSTLAEMIERLREGIVTIQKVTSGGRGGAWLGDELVKLGFK